MTRDLAAVSRRTLESWQGNEPYALITFRDPGLPLAVAPSDCRARLDLVCHDTAEEMRDLPGPSKAVAAQVVQFVRSLPDGLSLVVQCEAGIGRSLATVAALDLWQGGSDWRAMVARGTHNRRLYRLLCEELGAKTFTPEPLVAMAVRVKYPLDRMTAFLVSMQRQRWQNWRCVFVTDGPQTVPSDFTKVATGDWPTFFSLAEPRCIIVQTPERRGLWGHPYRQVGIDRCLGLLQSDAAYIGLNNDDNYLTPGYLEQLVNALEDGAGLALCDTAHAYSAWGVVPGIPKCGTADVGNWLARADVVRATPWDGTDFAADGRYVERLAAAAGKVVRVPRVLFVKN